MTKDESLDAAAEFAVSMIMKSRTYTNEYKLEQVMTVIRELQSKCSQLEAALQATIPRDVVSAIVMDGAGYVLIGKRRATQSFPGKWCFPGGKVEPGESLHLAVERELREECELEVRVGVEVHTELVQYKHGTFRLHYFDCKPYSEAMGGGTAKEFDMISWVHPTDLPEYQLLPVDIDLAHLIRLRWQIGKLRVR